MQQNVRLTARVLGMSVHTAATHVKRKERSTTMLVFVPQGFVALVYEDGALRAVLEAGVGVVARADKVQVQFVNLQPDEEREVQATLQ